MPQKYIASPTIEKFMQSNARRRVLQGPFRSGKSVGCCMEIMRRAFRQAPGPDGIRRSRWVIIRSTMKQLMDTTFKTWVDWVPPGLAGTWKSVAKTFEIKYGDVHAEVMFRALDDAADVANLLSLEVTGAYMNESREIHQAIVEALDGRIGMYPMKEKGGCTWYGMFADTNPPSEGEYWHSILEDVDPATKQPGSGWTIFKQPSGLSAKAENVENLPDNYYKDLAKGKSPEFVRVFIKNEYGKSRGGRAVHPLFDKDKHVSSEPLMVNPDCILLLSFDFGRTPACAFMQLDPFGRMIVFDEIWTEGMGLDRCLKERVKPLLKNRFADLDVRVTGDPSGGWGTQTDEQTCRTIFRDNGFRKVKFASSNKSQFRQESLDYFLEKDSEIGHSFLVDPRCKMIIQGLQGSYCFPLDRKGNTKDEVEKNMWSHICEAVEYGATYYKDENDNAAHRRTMAQWTAAAQKQVAFAGTYSLRR